MKLTAQIIKDKGKMMEHGRLFLAIGVGGLVFLLAALLIGQPFNLTARTLFGAYLGMGVLGHLTVLAAWAWGRA